MAASTIKLTNERVADCVKRISDAIAQRQAVETWVRQNIVGCPFNCDEEGYLMLTPFSDGVEYRVPCPNLTQECACGRQLINNAAKRALAMLPADFPTAFKRHLLEPRSTLAKYGAMRWNGKGFLYIYGGTGSGKSFAAAWRVYDDNFQKLMRYWDTPGRWNQLSICRARWFSAYSVCIDRANLYEAEQAPMLVLDDLGCDVETPTNKATINELIGVRYNFERPTIITSNLNPEDISRRYMPRMYERLVQSNNFVDAGMESLRLN